MYKGTLVLRNDNNKHYTENTIIKINGDDLIDTIEFPDGRFYVGEINRK